jgi:hypothetical protein
MGARETLGKFTLYWNLCFNPTYCSIDKEHSPVSESDGGKVTTDPTHHNPQLLSKRPRYERKRRESRSLVIVNRLFMCRVTANRNDTRQVETLRA